MYAKKADIKLLQQKLPRQFFFISLKAVKMDREDLDAFCDPATRLGSTILVFYKLNKYEVFLVVLETLLTFIVYKPLVS